MRLKNPTLSPQAVWLCYGVFISALSWALFGSLLALPHDLDDLPALRDNLKIDEDLRVIVHGFYHPSGRPVGHLLRWLVYLVWGNDIRVFHALSVAVHTANALLLAFLGRQLGLSHRVSLLAGVLFLVHIAHFKAVHHVAALEYLLAVTWSISAFIALEHFLSCRSYLHLAAFYSFTALAVASHIAASALLLVAAFYVWTKTGNDRKVWRSLSPLLGLVLLLLYSLLSHTSSQSVPTTTGRALHYLSGEELPALVLTAAKMLLWFTAQLFAFSHVMIGHLWMLYDWQLLFGILVLACFVWFLRRDRQSPVILCLAWSIVFLLPFVLQDEQTIRDVPGPSRYLYTASVGSSFVIAHLLVVLMSSKSRWVQGTGAVIAAAAMVSSAVALKQVEALSYYTASLRYKSEGDLGHSLEFMEKALAEGQKVLPLEEAYRSLLLTQTSLDSGKARRQVQELLRRDPGSPTLGVFQSVFASEEDREDEQKMESRLKGLGQDLLVSAIFSNWAKSQVQFDAKNSLLSLQRAIAFDPDNVQALYLYGALLVDMGNLEGLRYYVRAIDLDKQYDRFMVLIHGLKQKHQLEEAVDYAANLGQTVAATRFVELARQASN